MKTVTTINIHSIWKEKEIYICLCILNCVPESLTRDTFGIYMYIPIYIYKVYLFIYIYLQLTISVFPRCAIHLCYRLGDTSKVCRNSLWVVFCVVNSIYTVYVYVYIYIYIYCVSLSAFIAYILYIYIYIIYVMKAYATSKVWGNFTIPS